jgi:hypothetical protein
MVVGILLDDLVAWPCTKTYLISVPLNLPLALSRIVCLPGIIRIPPIR